MHLRKKVIRETAWVKKESDEVAKKYQNFAFWTKLDVTFFKMFIARILICCFTSFPIEI